MKKKIIIILASSIIVIGIVIGTLAIIKHDTDKLTIRNEVANYNGIEVKKYYAHIPEPEHYYYDTDNKTWIKIEKGDKIPKDVEIIQVKPEVETITNEELKEKNKIK